ncbi:hypothetical protein Pcinc_020321 [Petrolisthes cinctipes]|uniref:Uncharacterized protein n=1 Tax=Petrolisthes cinctipes TaxID=88211 RepID=A0AAE1FKF8_PETCI|nr:hypothetical protein Pcinc_020321 [Petrolisthes cinctipes]
MESRGEDSGEGGGMSTRVALPPRPGAALEEVMTIPHVDRWAREDQLRRDVRPSESPHLSRELSELSESSPESQRFSDSPPNSPIGCSESAKHTKEVGNLSQCQDNRRLMVRTRKSPQGSSKSLQETFDSTKNLTESSQGRKDSTQAGRESSQESTEGIKSSETCSGGTGSSGTPSWPASPSSGYHSAQGSSGDTPSFTHAQGRVEDCWVEDGKSEEWWGKDKPEGEDWCEGEWPTDRALPLPRWGCARPDLTFSSLQDFTTFLNCLTPHLHDTLTKHCYDTLSNFINFCESYIWWREGMERGAGLDQFYHDYDPPLLPGRHTCVGLTCLLQSRLSSLEPRYPGIKDATYKVSCEEEVEQVEWYCEGEVPPYTCEKEHVLVCVRVRIAGRVGVVLLDPGYHVGVPVVVMEDGTAPQSGPVPGSSSRPGLTRTYHYLSWAANPGYVTWNVTTQPKDGPATHHVSLIHVARPFLSHVDVAERRNLAYPFKTLVARDPSGVLTCGLYFPLRHPDQAHVTLFSCNMRCKVLLSYFLGHSEHDERVEAALWEVGLGTGRGKTQIRNAMATVASLLADASLLNQLEALNQAIDLISREN